MKKFFTIFIAGLILLLPTSANAVAYHSYGVTSEEKELVAAQETNSRNFFEEIEYRMLEKDEDYDTADYAILGVIIILILIVIIELNKKTYVVRSETVFEESITNDIEISEEDNKGESNIEVVEEEVSN